MKNGKLNKREIQVIRRAWDILSNYLEMIDGIEEANGRDPLDNDSMEYVSASNVVASLCEFNGAMYWMQKGE